MFYTTSQIIKLRVKQFSETIPGALFFAGVLILLALMVLSENIAQAIWGDILAFGLAGFAAYVYYRYYEVQKQKAKAAARRSAVARKKAVAPAPAPIVTPAPVVKPVFFDFEAHE